MRATPAGKEMNVRTIGRSRLKNAVAAPYLSKNRSASSISCSRISRYFPYRSMGFQEVSRYIGYERPNV